MTPKVSIIVPVHNAGSYFTRCLESLINQTLTDIEILLVLDVPTDGSDKIAQDYALKDARIRIFKNEKNLHIGLSRNVGIEYADGEYIGFSDDDDFCEPQMFEILYINAKKAESDIVVSNYCNEFNSHVDNYYFPEETSLDIFKRNYFEALIRGNHSKPNMTTYDNVNAVWNQIFRRDFLIENNIRFSDNRIVTFEDVIFNIQAHFYAKKVSFVSEIFYRHLMNEKNAYRSYDYLSINKVISHVKLVYEFLRKNDVDKQYETSFALCTLHRLYTSCRNEIKFKKITSTGKFIRTVKYDKIIQQILQSFLNGNELLNRLTITKRIFFYLIKD